MLKRPRDAFDTPDSSSPPLPASKRRFLSSSSPAGPSSVRSTPLSTPYTLPYFSSPFALSVPHDSPSNPFGLNRTLRALTLPRPTGFSKHIVLRMQVVSTTPPRRRLSSRKASPPEAPYRVVQVPLNYSFRLLHMLVLFLFASDARLRVRRPKGAATCDAPPSTSRSKSASVPEPTQSEGHLFEVFEGIRLYANTYKPGVIKAGTGRLYARLSSTRERKLFPDELAGEDENIFMSDELDDDGGWVWEAEDDYLLSNVWSDGPDLKKGIIYHHTATTAIHITANQSRVPPRKGIGNTPYVFAAHGGTAGAVRMANVAPSPPPSSAPPSKADASSKRRRKHKSDSSPDSQSDTGSSSGSGWSSSSSSSSHKREPEPIPLNDGEEVPDLRPHEDANEQQLERWNAHRAFERFLKREAARERAMRRVSQSASKPTSSRSNGKEVGRGPPTRRRRLHDDDAPSSPVRPLPRAHRYGYGEGYGAAGRGRSALASEGEDPSGADRDPDALPPSSPSTLPAILSSDCDVWTDTDGDPGCSSGSGRESGVPFPLGRDRADDAEEDWGAADEEAAAENRRYMIELPLQTPFPANPVLRRRVRRASEKIERQVSRGLGEMSDEDDEDGREGETRAKVNVKRDPGADERDSKERAKAEGKENARDVAAAADRYPPPVKAIPVPIPHLHSQPRTGRKTPTITSAVAPPTPESVSPRREDGEGGGGDEDDGDDSDGTGSTGSVEVDGFSISSLSSAAPWLAMRGPEDGSGDDGGGWESEDEI